MITATLEALNSRRDIYGKRCALRFTDHATGKVVCGTVSGGESNIYGVLRHWNTPDDWDRSIRFEQHELPICEFNRLVKDWAYAGYQSEDLAKFIRDRL